MTAKAYLPRRHLHVKHAWLAACACIWLAGAASVHADEIQDDRVVFIEASSAECDGLDGKLISVQNVDQDKTLEVWLERWVAGVPSSEHYRYTLLPNKQALALGCSMTAEGDQHWKVTGVDSKQR